LVILLTLSQLPVDFGYRLLQHATMPGLGYDLELANQAGAGEQQALAFPVELLLGIRQLPMGGFGLIAHFGLLLFYGLTFPPACHFGSLNFTFCERT